MKVLSLFDGISCGRLALDRAGIPVENYYRSEIDKYANIIAKKNYPGSIDLGVLKMLQTLPDNYTEGVSNTQRYKALGNGWTVDVIAHILSGMKEN